MSCQKFVHTEEPDMDWVCVCRHDSDWHNLGPSNRTPGGPCEACADPALGEHSSNPREDG